jgi:hypothetical protein
MFNNGKMCVFIRKDAYEVACSIPHTSEEFRHLMRVYQGTWMDVDTDHLFRDQFNVKTRMDGWVRLPYIYIAMVRNDARLGKKLCLNCGKSSVYKDSMGRIHKSCPNCKIEHPNAFWIYQQDHSTNGVIC